MEKETKEKEDVTIISLDDSAEETEFETVDGTNLPAKIIQDLQLAPDVVQMRTAAQLLIDSGTLPEKINTPEKVFIITKYGKELGIGEVTALNSLNIIKGKVSMTYQLMGSLLKKRNYHWEVIADFKKILDNDGNHKGNFETIIRFSWIPQYLIDVAEKHNRPDLLKMFVHDERRTWAEFQKAGFIKNMWDKLPKLMMRIRTFAFGARIVAPEALANMYEASELADSNGLNYVMNTNGDIQMLDKDPMEFQDR